jgi:hypothetical protein
LGYEGEMDDTTILQVDGGIIAGLLVFLTLTSLIPFLTGPLGNIVALLLTAGVMFPFAISAVLVLSKYIKGKWRLTQRIINWARNRSGYAGNATYAGFVYLMGVIVGLFIFNVLPIFNVIPVVLPSPLAEVCKKYLTEFEMDSDSCARIEPGSIYEECVKKTMPNMEKVKLCSKFMTF